MELEEIFLLYGNVQPIHYEIKDTSHGVQDFRQAIITEWEDKKLVIKITCNAFTTVHRVECWHDTIEAYREMGYYCPRIVLSKNGRSAERILYEEKECLVFAEEFSKYQTAEQFGKKQYKIEDTYVYRNDAILFMGKIGEAHLTLADFPSGLCILESFSPSEEYDEVWETALDFKSMIEESYPELKERFQLIWDKYVTNKMALEEIYPQLPKSIFQADLNPTNVVLDENMQFCGVIDFNLAGYDTMLNVLFRESWIDFHEDVPYREKENMFFSEEINEKAMQSFLRNIQIVKETYAFSEIEKEAAILVYRYLRPFWWQPFHMLSDKSMDGEKAERLLAWIEQEQAREIDFAGIML